MHSTTQPAPIPPHATRPPAQTLDTLSTLSSGELEALYRAASAPATVRAADGALIGRMLAVRGLPRLVAEPVRRWAASPSFVWAGKSFQAASDSHGKGHNRVFLPGVLGRQDLFPFDTRLGSSALDGRPTIILDYDLDVNPAYIRHIHDEIRPIEPGLFLGPAMWKRGAARALLLWFALDARPR